MRAGTCGACCMSQGAHWRAGPCKGAPRATDQRCATRTAHASAPLSSAPAPTHLVAHRGSCRGQCLSCLVGHLLGALLDLGSREGVDRADAVGADAKSAAGWATEASMGWHFAPPCHATDRAPHTFSAARARCTSPSPIANSSCTSTTWGSSRGSMQPLAVGSTFPAQAHRGRPGEGVMAPSMACSGRTAQRQGSSSSGGLGRRRQ